MITSTNAPIAATRQLMIAWTSITRAGDRIDSSGTTDDCARDHALAAGVTVVRRTLTIVEQVATGRAPRLPPVLQPLPGGGAPIPGAAATLTDLYSAHAALERAAELLALADPSDIERTQVITGPFIRQVALGLNWLAALVAAPPEGAPILLAAGN